MMWQLAQQLSVDSLNSQHSKGIKACHPDTLHYKGDASRWPSLESLTLNAEPHALPYTLLDGNIEEGQDLFYQDSDSWAFMVSLQKPAFQHIPHCWVFSVEYHIWVLTLASWSFLRWRSCSFQRPCNLTKGTQASSCWRHELGGASMKSHRTYTMADHTPVHWDQQSDLSPLILVILVISDDQKLVISGRIPQ